MSQIGCSIAGFFARSVAVLRPVFVNSAQPHDFKAKSWGRNYRKAYRFLN
jgi:hypothetical protein